MQINDTHYKPLFENSPISHWEEDFSRVKVYLDQLPVQGIAEFEGYLARNPEELERCTKLVRVLDINVAAMSLHRISDKSSIKDSLEYTFTKQSSTAFKQELIAIWKGLTCLQMEATIKTIAGNLVDVAVYWSVLPGSEMTYNRVVISLVDISEYKLLAGQFQDTYELMESRVVERTLKLSEANERLRLREMELRSLLDNSPDMILKTDPHLKVMWANRTSLEMNPDCIGLTCYQAFPGRSEICEGCPVVKALKTKRIERGVMYQPISDTAPDEQYWENIGVPQFDRNNEVIACIEISRNITDRMQIAKKLDEANKELAAFAYSVSHDLRTPTRHITGFLEMLEKRIAATLDEKSQYYIDTIFDASKRMGSMIDGLLYFLRIGQQELSRSEIDLQALVDEIIHEFIFDETYKDINWHITNLPTISADRSLIRMVLENLISNAIKFTRTRSIKEIEIGYNNKKTENIIYIRDNGVGFDMQYADKLFNVFQRLHRAEDFEGTGIGLASASRIINRHGGKIWTEAEIGKGATFFFSLPKTIKK